MPKKDTLEIAIPPRQVPAGQLLTARSYLLDRIEPDCEHITLPAKQAPGGHVRASLGPVNYPARKSPRKRKQLVRKVLGTPSAKAPRDRILVDLRIDTPHNWAHFLNIHLPFLFALLEGLEIDWTRALIVMPPDIPKYISRVAELFGLELWPTDAAIEGFGVTYSAEPWLGLRAMRREWALLPRVQEAVQRLCARGAALPERVFLARRDTRAVSNMGEVMEVLSPLGFETVYPEDLSPADQFRLFRDPQALVAIHGAGLAPLLYRPPNPKPCQFVELLPCGHMTDVYRAMADQVDASWIGVRGRMKPEYIQPAYDLDRPFQAFSLDNFEVDPESLRYACDALDLERSPIRWRN